MIAAVETLAPVGVGIKWDGWKPKSGLSKVQFIEFPVYLLFVWMYELQSMLQLLHWIFKSDRRLQAEKVISYSRWNPDNMIPGMCFLDMENVSAMSRVIKTSINDNFRPFFTMDIISGSTAAHPKSMFSN